MPTSATSTSRRGRDAERRAEFHYRLRGYRVLDRNAWAGGYELDLVVRRGRRVVFAEVKAKGGPAFGDPLEMVSAEKLRRLRQAAETWLAGRPEERELELSFEIVGLSGRRLRRVPVVP